MRVGFVYLRIRAGLLYRDELPNRVRTVVIGGGIHGAAVLHDLVSRGWRDIILLESNRVGGGASCRSQKFAPLLPGSSEAWTITDARILAKEAPEIARLAPDLCQSSTVDFRLNKKFHGLLGLGGAYAIGMGKNCHLTEEGLRISGYKFDDLGLVRRLARSAKMLGGSIAEETTVTKIVMDDDGYQLHGFDKDNKPFVIGSLYVINCAGKHAAHLLETSGILPSFNQTYVHEIFLMVDAPEFAQGLMWRSANSFPGMRFAIPWHRVLVVGPWRFETDKINQVPGEPQIKKGTLRLMEEVAQLGLEKDAVFSGFMRQRLFVDPVGASMLNWAPRSSIGEMTGKRGNLFTLYGGSFLNFRHYARYIGDQIMERFGERRPSQADSPQAWLDADATSDDEKRLRFEVGGLANDSLIKGGLSQKGEQAIGRL